MADIKILNELLYEVLGDMEDLTRSYVDESEEDDKELLLFLDKLKTELFSDNLTGFISVLDPKEE